MIWNGGSAQPAANSIAVPAFESQSPEKENVFLANGVHDGVSTKLAKMANLKVIRNTQEIGRGLNVAYVLKGSVRREHREDCHDRIHINAQLIDSRTDAHVWAQEYDRELCHVWALQGDIAQKVAECIAAKAKIPLTTKPIACISRR